jgi:hypothetical protein
MKEKNIFRGICENDNERLKNLLDGARFLFKIYESFVKAGFDETQAFYLTSEVLKGGLKNG